jgi:hypothetical protein
LGKILALVQAKMKEKEEKGDDEKEGEEKEEKKAAAVGDIAKQWSFVKTAIGKQLDAALDGKSKPSEAIAGAADGIKSALTAGVKAPLEGIADRLTFGNGGNKFVSKQVKIITDRITRLILELTTLDGFLESGAVIGALIDGAEESLGKACADKAKTGEAIDAISHDLWHKGITKVAMALWIRIWKLQEKITSVMSSLPEEASTSLVDLLSHIFEVQLRAFNGIRVQYVRNLREGIDEIKDAESAVRVSRASFKGAMFPVINLLGFHHWIRAHKAFELSAKVIVKDVFERTLWGPIKDGLTELESCIPEELKSMGLQLVPLVRAVINFIIDKGLEWAMKKVFIFMERALFTQDAE